MVLVPQNLGPGLLQADPGCLQGRKRVQAEADLVPNAGIPPEVVHAHCAWTSSWVLVSGLRE